MLKLAALCCLALFTVLCVCPCVANSAPNVLLKWNPSPSLNVSGYKVRIGLQSGKYSKTIDVGPSNSYVMNNALSGTTYYFVVIAYSQSKAVSAPSNEVGIFVPLDTITGTGNTSGQLKDSDRDGLTDSSEALLGTSAQLSDSDGDKVEDGQESLDGTDPLDAGSFSRPLPTLLCAEWNGFLGGMFNILEHTNLSSKTIRVSTVLYDIEGNPLSETSFSLKANNQYDLLVHDLKGWELNRIGRICSSHNGQPGDLDGRMVYYKPETNLDTGKTFEFAFALPFQNSVSGNQFVSFNTFQPSFDPADQNNLVANWIQITNQTNRKQRGTVVFYNADGKIIGDDTILLSPSARADVAGHQFGSNQVGLVEWIPEDPKAAFALRNVRYLYDNPNLVDSFSTAYQLSGEKGSGQALIVPLSTQGKTSVLEISNTLDLQLSVDFSIMTSLGTELKRVQLKFPGHATRHFVLDEILRGASGVAIISSSQKNSLIATAMEYARTPTGKISYMYGIQALEAQGSTMTGSYNTFLEQKSLLLVTNISDSPQKFSLSLTRVGGQVISLSNGLRERTVPAHGMVEIDLNELEGANKYGIVEMNIYPNLLTPHDSLTAWVLREKVGNYVMTTLMRR